MFPKVELTGNKQTFTRREVEEMIDSLNSSCASMLAVQAKLYRFAKIISYISLTIALLLIAKEVFM